MGDAWGPALLSVLGVSLLSLTGAAVLGLGPERVRATVPYLVAMSAGALLASAFLHLLPEAAEAHGGFEGVAAWSVLIGVLGFFGIESVIHWHHHGEDVEDHAHGRISSLAWMNLLSDGIHNVIDGVVIAGAWMASPAAGLTTTLAVALHEIPQEFGDFGVLLHSGLRPRRALLLNAASGAAAVLAAGAVLLAGEALDLGRWLVPLAAGGFIYMACADLLPEIHRRAQDRRRVLTVAALFFGVAIVAFLPDLIGLEEHGHGHGTAVHGPGLDHDQGGLAPEGPAEGVRSGDPGSVPAPAERPVGGPR